jgi:hypothetical protein
VIFQVLGEKYSLFQIFIFHGGRGVVERGSRGAEGAAGGGTEAGRMIFEVLGEKYSLFKNLSFCQNSRPRGNPF